MGWKGFALFPFWEKIGLLLPSRGYGENEHLLDPPAVISWQRLVDLNGSRHHGAGGRSRTWPDRVLPM